MHRAEKLLRPQRFGRTALRGEILTPMCTAGFTLMGTILLSTLVRLRVIWIAAAVLGIMGALFILPAVLLRKGRFRVDLWALVCVMAAIGLLLAGYQRADLIKARERFAGQNVTVSGTVSGVKTRSDSGCSFLIKNGTVITETGETGKADILFYTDGELTFHGGEKTVLQTTLSDEITLAQIGMGAELVSYRAAFVEDTGYTALYPLYRARDRLLTKLRSRIYTCLPRDNAGLLIGMLTGSKEQLSDRDNTLLQGAGLAHLLAVSGLHIMIFFQLVQLLLRKLGRRAALIAALPVTACYVFLTGGSESSSRAFIMIALLTVAELLRMPKSTINALGFAVIIFCVTDPMCVLQSGTLLSILSVWCLYVAVPAVPLPTTKTGSFLRSGVAAVFISVVTVPVMMLMTGYLPMLSPFCSMLVLPVMPVVLVLGLCCGILGGNFMGKLLGAAADLLLSWIRFCAKLGNAGPKIPLGGELVRVCCTAVLILFILSALLLGTRQISLHRSLFAALTAVILAVTGVCGVFSAQREDGINIICIENTLVLHKGRQALAIGSGKTGYAGQTIAGYLRAAGVTELTLLIPEEKASFTGGAYDLLVRFPADTVLTESEAEGDSRLQNALAAAGENAEVVSLGGSSLWSLFGNEKMSVRRGNEGLYIFLELDGHTFTLQDKDDPVISPSDYTIWYDDPSYFAENCAILSEEKLSGFLAGEEMPPWEAGFLMPEWEIYVTSDHVLFTPKA